MELLCGSSGAAETGAGDVFLSATSWHKRAVYSRSDNADEMAVNSKLAPLTRNHQAS